ncbi:MAG: hypothetical protein JXA94_07505 [Parachlamydiales bacterium]|nr:hypothetical protein [Parachlamydiales bacterium]
MNRKEKLFISLSIIFSIAIHVIAIASINYLPIKTYQNSKTLAFADKKNSKSQRKPSQEIVNFVIQQKQNQNIKTKGEKSILPSSQKEEEYLSVLKEKETDKDTKNPAFKSSNDVNLSLINSKNTLPVFILKEENKITPALIDNIKKPSIKIKNFKPQEKPSVHPEQETKKDSTFVENESDFKNPENNILSTAFFKNFLDDDKFLIKSAKKSHLKRLYSIFTSHPPLLTMPSLEELTTLAYKDFFNIDVSFAPEENGNGFIFAITLLPKSNLKLEKLKQNVFFLVDRSNSIQKERLSSTRHAIASALQMLDKEDTFNVLAFDTKLDVLFERNMHPTSNNISKTKSFLLDQKIGSFFSSTNYSMPLYKVLNSNVKEGEINIAILLSNGDGLNKTKNYHILNEWTKNNMGNLSLFTLCLSDDKNEAILELFSTLNKGKLLSSNTNRGIKRKLQKLVKSINYPIARNITSTSVCLDKSANIKLYPNANQSPNLFLDEPYVILGTCEKLEDFTLFIQGDCKNNFFNLKKHIAFDSAKQGGEALQKEIAKKRATEIYEKYIADNKKEHLQEANNILKSFEIEPVFR